MQEIGSKPSNGSVIDLGFSKSRAFWNLKPEELEEIAIRNGQAKLTSSGAIAIDTGEFTGRSPKDKFTVKDDVTASTVWWNNFNIPFSPENFDKLYYKVLSYLDGKDIYIRDVYACSDWRYRMSIRVVNEYAWSNLFAHNMFINPTAEELIMLRQAVRLALRYDTLEPE